MDPNSPHCQALSGSRDDLCGCLCSVLCPSQGNKNFFDKEASVRAANEERNVWDSQEYILITSDESGKDLRL